MSAKPTYTPISEAAAKAFDETVNKLVIEKLGPIAGLTTQATFADDKFAGTPSVPNAISNESSIKI